MARQVQTAALSLYALKAPLYNNIIGCDPSVLTSSSRDHRDVAELVQCLEIVFRVE